MCLESRELMTYLSRVTTDDHVVSRPIDHDQQPPVPLLASVWALAAI
jgi:hypothetical protein